MSERLEEIGEYITLARAGEIAGYIGYGNLRRAAATEKLKTVQVGRTRLTTRAWLEEYLATLGKQAGRPRGQPRKPQQPPQETTR
jgi:hypothetical protein